MSHTTSSLLHKSCVRVVVSALILIGVLISATVANATPLGINSLILGSPVPGTGGGGLVATKGPLPFSAATFSGTLLSQVFANDPANPFGPGNLTFEYLLSNTSVAGANAIERMSVAGYGVPGLLTDASYFGGGVPVTFFTRSDVPGDVIGADYAPPNTLVPGTTSALIVIHTNQTLFNDSIANVIDGSIASVDTYAPLAFNPTPEPSTFVLGSLGLICVSVVRLRRRASAR